MPRTSSAQKALRQNVKRRVVNAERRANMKFIIKKFKKLIDSGKKEEAKKYLSEVYKKIDKMKKVRLIKKGRANRIKSRFSKKIK